MIYTGIYWKIDGEGRKKSLYYIDCQWLTLLKKFKKRIGVKVF